MSKYIGLYLLLMLGFVSCNIKENMSNCPGTILLDYTSYSDEILDDIKPDERVNIYIFDRTRLCDRIYSFTYEELEQIDFEFEVPIQYSGCYAVVWHGNDSPDYSCLNMIRGEKLDDFALRLNADFTTNELSHCPAPLWASPLEPIEYCSTKSRHRIFMTRVHTEVNVNLRQIGEGGVVKEIDMSDYLTTIEAKNDIYNTDYMCNDGSELVKYTNSEELDLNSYLDLAHVGTLRITPDMKCLMTIAPAAQPDKPITVAGSTHFDLVKYMLQSRNGSRAEGDDEPKISDQLYLDLNKVWDVDLLIGSGAVVSLTINGWTVWFDDVDLN